MKETIILLGIAGLLFRPACQAQVSIAQPQHGSPAAQFHERLLSACKSGKTQCVSRTSPKIANPQAKDSSNNPTWLSQTGQFVGPKITVLKNQKQNADREAQEMQRSFPHDTRTAAGAKGASTGAIPSGGMKEPGPLGGAPGTKEIVPNPGNQPAGTTAAEPEVIGKSARSNAAGSPRAVPGQQNTKGANTAGPPPPLKESRLGGTAPSTQQASPFFDKGKVPTTVGQTSNANPIQRNGAPQGALKTESATGSGSPGSGSNTTVSTASQTSNSAATNPTVAHAVCMPNIGTISGYPTALFSPIPIFNPYPIKGCGFGNQMGNVYLTGSFYAGKIPLTVLTSPGNRRSPGRASWSDTAIVVTVDPKLSGELNQQNVTLVVEPVGGAPIQKAGNEFLAFYEDVTLAPIPQSAVAFFKGVAPSVGGKKTTSTVNTGNTTTTATLSEVSTPDPVYITPSQTGMSAGVFREGTIMEFFLAGSDLFDLSGLTPSFQPLYFQLQHDDPTGCSVTGSWKAAWEGQKVRVTWEEFLCNRGWMSAVWSNYALSVVVKGPRGIDPWNGQRLLSVSPVRALP